MNGKTENMHPVRILEFVGPHEATTLFWTHCLLSQLELGHGFAIRNAEYFRRRCRFSKDHRRDFLPRNLSFRETETIWLATSCLRQGKVMVARRRCSTDHLAQLALHRIIEDAVVEQRVFTKGQNEVV